MQYGLRELTCCLEDGEESIFPDNIISVVKNYTVLLRAFLNIAIRKTIILMLVVRCTLNALPLFIQQLDKKQSLSGI